ncbi:hypothetical protein H5410_034353 [Solanum commersonii]|uniref:Uncharacterized protein n=1 Tax=Solanum commersonii TaxID=4109 RepID=A0A9J5YT62_SOLCO|nr:hypothetical protein H5410_034353 [Solanum commersonii]
MVVDSQNGCQIIATQTQQHQDGLRTPTSKEHKIPMKCPKTPRKAKSSSVLATNTVITKRKRKMFFDVYSDEVELLFPPALLADLINKITTTT